MQESDPQMVKSLLIYREGYPYILDLVKREILFFDALPFKGYPHTFEIRIDELKEELKRLLARIESFQGLITNL